jgi:hypothetical protein
LSSSLCSSAQDEAKLVEAQIKLLEAQECYFSSSALLRICMFVNKLYTRLKKLSTTKANKMKTPLMLSICFFCIPLIIKAVFNLAYIIFSLEVYLVENSFKNNDVAFSLYMILYYTITELVPMGAQIISVNIATSDRRGELNSSQKDLEYVTSKISSKFKFLFLLNSI